MKKLLLLLLCVPLIGFGQDIIVLKNGEKLSARVLNQDDKNVTYTIFENKDGVVYLKSIDDISLIKFEDGQIIKPKTGVGVTGAVLILTFSGVLFALLISGF